MKIAAVIVFILIIFLSACTVSFYTSGGVPMPIVEHSDDYFDMSLNDGINYSISIKYSSEGSFCIGNVVHVVVYLTIHNDMFFDMVKNSYFVLMFNGSQASPISYFLDDITPLAGGFSKEVHSKTITTDCNVSYSETGQHSYVISFITDEGKILYARNLRSTLQILSLDKFFETSNEKQTLTLTIIGVLLGLIGILSTVFGILLSYLIIFIPKIDTIITKLSINIKNNKLNKHTRK